MSSVRPILGGVILVYFIIALEVLIMISPFAAFFYAAFNPVLLLLAQSPATRWLSAFFLPHMVVPPDLFLKTVRVAGSVLFVGGAFVFVVCAAQVYFHKLIRGGPALGGQYRWIRHPQYLALGATGLGLAILWPRLLTVVLWTVMAGLYYLLARDEERRMLSQFGEQYRAYMAHTGMFVPLSLERAARRPPWPGSPVLRGALGFALLLAVAVGGALALRAYTISRLPVWSDGGRVAAIAILPGDDTMLEHRMADLLEVPAVRARLAATAGPILAYLIPTHYVMQGMIADTGPTWRLYEQHQTISMITDWILHPFRHLQADHAAMHQDGVDAPSSGTSADAAVRRLIFLSIDAQRPSASPASLFAINATRRPLFYIDVSIHDLVLLDIEDLGPGTGWGRVPTPMF